MLSLHGFQPIRAEGFDHAEWLLMGHPAGRSARSRRFGRMGADQRLRRRRAASSGKKSILDLRLSIGGECGVAAHSFACHSKTSGIPVPDFRGSNDRIREQQGHVRLCSKECSPKSVGEYLAVRAQGPDTRAQRTAIWTPTCLFRGAEPSILKDSHRVLN